ncbi:hypothetical protein AC249_AIPGENE23025 [Exaiptasia diaphana]|nr:hypothetical protein AC249_AIPGENE23025 [Exaiptasia diaphana]
MLIKGLVEVGIDKNLLGNRRIIFPQLVARQPDEEDSDLSDSQNIDSSEIQESDSEEEGEEGEQENDELSASPESSIDSGSDYHVEVEVVIYVCRDFKQFYTQCRTMHQMFMT